MKAKRVDRHRTLQQLEGVDWGDPDPAATRLVTECHRLRRKPLVEFTAGDLRVMIGQEIGLPYLVPLALEVLEGDPLAEGDCFPGDLLAAVTGVGDDFWKGRPDWHDQACRAVERAKAVAPALDTFERRTVERLLREASTAFERVR